MKRKFCAVALTLLIVLAALSLTACNNDRLKKLKGYYLYTYDASQGKFVKSLSKIVFKNKQKYYFYDKNNMLKMAGDYHINDDVITLIPDNIGNQNRMEAAVCLLSYKDYLINPENAYVKAGEDEKISEFEGLYGDKFKLKDGKIFKSAYDNPDPESFTVLAGEYERDLTGDFVTLFFDGKPSVTYLRYFCKDELNRQVSCLAQSIFCHKEIDFKGADIAAVDLQKSVFAYQEENALGYELNLIAYPSKEKIITGAEFRLIDASSPSAFMQGSSLFFEGDGWADIEYKYGSFKDIVKVYIVKFELEENIPDINRVYNAGETASYLGIIDKLVIYTDVDFARYIVKINNDALAVDQEGQIKFIKEGTVEVMLFVRYIRNSYIDGSWEVLELNQTINLFIE